MKRLLMPILCPLMFAACNSKPANVNKRQLPENGATSQDTSAPSSKIVFESMEDTTTVENSTGRFAPAGHKKLIMDNGR